MLSSTLVSDVCSVSRNFPLSRGPEGCSEGLRTSRLRDRSEGSVYLKKKIRKSETQTRQKGNGTEGKRKSTGATITNVRTRAKRLRHGGPTTFGPAKTHRSRPANDTGCLRYAIAPRPFPRLCGDISDLTSCTPRRDTRVDITSARNGTRVFQHYTRQTYNCVSMFLVAISFLALRFLITARIKSPRSRPINTENTPIKCSLLARY